MEDMEWHAVEVRYTADTLTRSALISRSSYCKILRKLMKVVGAVLGEA